MATVKTTYESLANAVLVLKYWYFGCQLNKLNLASDDFVGCGDAVDTGDQILPLQVPGSAMAEQNRSFDVCENRIQFVEMNPVLLMSVYMPWVAKLFGRPLGSLAQLSEILTKPGSKDAVISEEGVLLSKILHGHDPNVTQTAS